MIGNVRPPLVSALSGTRRGTRRLCSALRAGMVCAALLLSGCESGLDDARGWLDSQSLNFPWKMPWQADESETLAKDPQSVRQVQFALARLGYQPGPADGVMGSKTEQAVRAYQRQNAMPEDGKITSDLIAILEQGVARRGKKPGPATHPPGAGASGKPKNGAPGRLALPVHDVGTTFVYSGGRADTIVEQKGSLIKWVRNDGFRFAADRNFLLPWTYWDSPGERGKMSLKANTPRLWPFSPDDKVAYSARLTVQRGGREARPKIRTESWKCSRAGQARVRVVAGTFRTEKIRCARGGSAAETARVLTWYYALGIRTYVRLEEASGDARPHRRVELVAILPKAKGWPPLTRAALADFVNQALTTAKNGETRTWSSSAIGERVTVKVLPRFVGSGGRKCRRFAQMWFGKSRRRHTYPAAACQDGSGDWSIPGLDNPAKEGLALSSGAS